MKNSLQMPSSRMGLVFSLMRRHWQLMADAESRQLVGELKSVYFGELLSLLRNCAAAHRIVLSPVVEATVTLGSSSHLCEPLGNMFNHSSIKWV